MLLLKQQGYFYGRNGAANETQSPTPKGCNGQEKMTSFISRTDLFSLLNGYRSSLESISNEACLLSSDFHIVHSREVPYRSSNLLLVTTAF